MSELGYSNLGFINLAIVYFTFSMASLFLSVPINKKLGHKYTMFFSAAAYAAWEFAFILPAYKYENYKDVKKDDLPAIFSDSSIIFFSIFSAVLIGLGAGPLWVSNNCYISECASHVNKGRFNALFYSIFQSSSITGTILSGILIERVSKTKYYIVMGVIGSIGTVIFLFLRKPQDPY